MGRKERSQKKGIIIGDVRAPTPHEECKHYVQQTCTNKKLKSKDKAATVLAGEMIRFEQSYPAYTYNGSSKCFIQECLCLATWTKRKG